MHWIGRIINNQALETKKPSIPDYFGECEGNWAHSITDNLGQDVFFTCREAQNQTYIHHASSAIPSFKKTTGPACFLASQPKDISILVASH